MHDNYSILSVDKDLKSKRRCLLYTILISNYSDLQEVIDTANMWETITRVLGPNQKVKESTRSKPKQKPEFPRQHDKKLE